MDREIKFRAFYKGNEKDKGGYIAGFNMISFHDYYTKGIEPKVKRYDKEWLLSEISLEQFTGLKDKNGRDIYENDILSNPKSQKSNFFVKFNVGGYDAVYDRYFTLCLHPVLHEFDGCEIIGNTNQNPELTPWHQS